MTRNRRRHSHGSCKYRRSGATATAEDRQHPPRFDRRGGMTGPDLTGVVSRYDTRTLLESLLEPSNVVPDRYATVIANHA